MSQIESHAHLSAIDLPVLAGSVILAHGGHGDLPLIALSEPDADGYLRFAPIVPADAGYSGRTTTGSPITTTSGSSGPPRRPPFAFPKTWTR